MSLVRVFFWGMMISFLGSLPMGTLNILAMKISVEEGVKHAIFFSCGSLLTEMIYVRVSLVAVNWIRKQKKLFQWLEWITLFIVVALAIGSFMTAIKHRETGAPLENNLPDMHRFLLGIVLSAISPMQIPFWFGWSTVLFTKKILLPKHSFYNLYIVGIGLGTLLGNCVFIFGGKWLIEKMNTNQNILNYVIGGIFAVTAIIQLVKILTHKDAAEKLERLGAEDQTPIGDPLAPNQQ
jgi:threonine/homoserine/homoserine lactone efflux protein